MLGYYLLANIETGIEVGQALYKPGNSVGFHDGSHSWLSCISRYFSPFKFPFSLVSEWKKKKNQRMNDYALHSFQILPGSRSRFRVLIESAGLFFLKYQNDIV